MAAIRSLMPWHATNSHGRLQPLCAPMVGKRRSGTLNSSSECGFTTTRRSRPRCASSSCALVPCLRGPERPLNSLDEIVLAYGNIFPSRMDDAPSVRGQPAEPLSIVGPRLEVLMIAIAIRLDDQSLFWIREINLAN